MTTHSMQVHAILPQRARVSRPPIKIPLFTVIPISVVHVIESRCVMPRLEYGFTNGQRLHLAHGLLVQCEPHAGFHPGHARA